jgi:ubiquitin-protein ligase
LHQQTNASEHSLVASSSSKGNLRAILKDYQTTQALLPSIRDASIALQYDCSQPRYARSCLSGPGDTVYFGGLFFFDIFLPANYPSVPPQIQFLTTAQGTMRFHTHLYADGKVCVSLLGNVEGENVERWDPKQSCLGQLLISIQSLILGDIAHNAKRPRAASSNYFFLGNRNQPSESAKLPTLDQNGEDYFQLRLGTIRYAMLPLLQSLHPPTTQVTMNTPTNTNHRWTPAADSYYPEYAPLIRAYYLANRHRIIQSLREDLAVLSSYQPSHRVSSSDNTKNAPNNASNTSIALLLQRFTREVEHVIDEFRWLSNEKVHDADHNQQAAAATGETSSSLSAADDGMGRK